MTVRPLVALLALPVVLALAACGPGTPPDDPDGIPVAEEVPDVPVAEEALELPDDAVFAAFAELTAENGATLDLLMVVHKSAAWDDPAAADRPALLIDQCSGAYDESVFADQLFSFASIDVTGTVGSGDWPAGTGVWLTPATDHLAVGSTGDLAEDPSADSETPHCKRDRQLAGPGTGTMVVAFRGDTDDVGAAGGFTRWANHNYGFAVFEAGPHFTECGFIVTPLGEEFGWDEPAETVDLSDICKFGIFVEDDDS
jgi:hypothetical protein